MKKMQISWTSINYQVASLAREIMLSEWKPDVIVGLTRGGLVPATMLSHYFDVPMHALKVSLRDHVDNNEYRLLINTDKKNVLVVDDINDTGATIESIKEQWALAAIPQQVKFAVLVHNHGSNQLPDYYATTVDKREDDVWIDYPWENWWASCL